VHRRLAVALATLAVASTGCAPSSPFNPAGARAHVERLADGIGPRPLGSQANAVARAYVAGELRRLGFTVRIQEAEGRNARFGVTGRVRNVIAFRDGRRPDAVGLIAHYDSVAPAPGAADDGIGVGVVLEAARVLAARPRTWSLAVVLTDGEEDGLLGATAAVLDPEVARRLRTYVNVEAMGPGRPGVLFESGPGNPWLLRAWARSAPVPEGASYFEEIYRNLPNDTDFTEFRRAGVPGLNMAAVGNIYVYHLPRDTADRIDPGVLADLGRNVVAWVEALDDVDITARETGSTVFFAVGPHAVSVPADTWRFVDLALLAAAALGWLRLLIVTWRRRGLARVAIACVWAVIGVIVIVLAAIAMVWLLRAAREVYHPWYAHPSRTVLLIVLAGVTAAWLLVRAGAKLPARLRAAQDPALVWIPALAAWTALAAVMASAAPLAAYLWTLPAGVAGAIVGAGAGSRRGVGIASAVVLAVVGLLWLPNARQLVAFAVPMSGMFPVVLPVPVLPILIAVPAMMIAPPVAALLAASVPTRPRFTTRLLVAALVVSFAWAHAADAYTVDRPERRQARYVVDVLGGTARWELGAHEPGPAAGAGGPLHWRLAHAGGVAPAPTLSEPFVYVADAPIQGVPVSATRRTASGDEGGVELEVLVQATRQDVWASLVLPDGLTPLDSNYPGRPRDGRWTAVYGTVPADGVTFRLRLPAEAAARLDDLRVVGRTSVPGAIAPGLGPPWLPEGRIDWAAWALYRVPVTAAN
jgi:hypothetical protein